MEGIAVILILGFLVLVIVLPIVAIIKSSKAQREVSELRDKLSRLIAAVPELRKRPEIWDAMASQPPPAPAAKSEAPAEPLVVESAGSATKPLPSASGDGLVEENPPAEESKSAGPPPLPTSVPGITASSEEELPTASSSPPLPPPLPPRPVAAKTPALSLEQFMGVKLFAWLGGLALFFGIVFFVKYAFEHDWISPALREAIGFAVGAGLLVAGVIVHKRKSYTVLAETFLGTGVLILYGVTYAGFAYWKPPLFSSAVAFGTMTLVTVTAFLTSARLNTLSATILGLVGGFLTPILCSTGEDHPWELFGYIALLDVGLLALARVKKWYFLASLGSAGTVLMQLAWFAHFFDKGRYFVGAASWTPILICVGFMVLFLIAAVRTKQDETGNPHPAISAMAVCGSALLFAFFFLGYPDITARTWLLYGFVFFINAAVIAGIVINPRLGPAQLAVGVATFLHLAAWTMQHLKPDALGSALAVYFIFGALHSVFPLVWQRLKPQSAYAVQGAFSPWFPPLTLVLMLLPVLSLPETSFIMWPAILLVDLLAIVVAVTTSVLIPVLVALVLTLAVAGVWLFKVPAETGNLMPFLIVVGGFAAFFAGAGAWLIKRFASPDIAEKKTANQQVAAMLPVMSGALPFVLLIMATARLPMDNPMPVFGLGLLLVLLQFGLAKSFRIPPLTLASLGCMFLLEISWDGVHFRTEQAWTALFWYIAIYFLFAIYPFAFLKTFRDTVLPWATAALAGVLQFILIHHVVSISFPSMANKLGLVPAIFAVPAIASLLGALRVVNATGKAREGQLAWFGGVTLLFITLIFPIQFRHQWITLSWALEGAALIWLFHRIPHQGLRFTGLGLLAAAFVRLALNPAILTYHPHGSTPIFNWYLYTYTIAAAAMFLGAWWLKEPNHKVAAVNARGVLWTAGGVLLFWLLNIEIADYFTPYGSEFTLIEFANMNLARDMTYSIAWGIFALGLILLGFVLNTRGARYAGIGLMAITLLKVFLHDLASLESIYRIAALIGVAVIALAASFLYQRFFDKTKNS
jgi:uncharacterized membrane protein